MAIFMPRGVACCNVGWHHGDNIVGIARIGEAEALSSSCRLAEMIATHSSPLTPVRDAAHFGLNDWGDREPPRNEGMISSGASASLMP